MSSALPQALSAIVGVLANAADGKLPVADAIKDPIYRDLMIQNGSLTSISSKLVLEPRIIVADDLRTNEFTEKAIDYNISLFIALYTRVFKLMTEIYGLDASLTLKLLSSVQTHSVLEEVSANLLSAYTGVISDELLSEINTDIPEFLPLEIEMHKDDKGKVLPTFIKEFELSTVFLNKSGVQQKITLPMLVRAPIEYVPVRDIVNAIEAQNPLEVSFMAQYHKWRSGSIGFLDFVFGLNLIRDYKKRKIRDLSKILDNIEERSRESVRDIIVHGVPGVGKYYQMIILGSNSKRAVETVLKGKLVKDKYKEYFLETLKSMAVTVLDDNFKVMTMQIKDFKDASEVSYSKLNSKTDTTNELLKMILMRGV